VHEVVLREVRGCGAARPGKLEAAGAKGKTPLQVVIPAKTIR